MYVRSGELRGTVESEQKDDGCHRKNRHRKLEKHVWQAVGKLGKLDLEVRLKRQTTCPRYFAKHTQRAGHMTVPYKTRQHSCNVYSRTHEEHVTIKPGSVHATALNPET